MATDSRWSCPERRGKAVCQTENLDPTCIHCGVSIFERSDGCNMVHIMKDVFDGTPNKSIIVQQVNCKGVMGKGLAQSIRERYPEVYEVYRGEYELGLLELGYTSYIQVEEDLYIANICGQYEYGRGKLFTNYNALKSGLEDVKIFAETLGYDVIIPYKLGCGLGGGNWNGEVLPMIESVFSKSLIGEIFQGGDVIE